LQHGPRQDTKKERKEKKGKEEKKEKSKETLCKYLTCDQKTGKKTRIMGYQAVKTV